MLNYSPNEHPLEYAGKRIRYALIVVELVNRRPIEIARDEFDFLDIDDEGRFFKEPQYEKGESLAFELLDPFLSDQTNNKVIDARYIFVKKRFFDKFSWTPTNKIVVGIAEIIFRKFI